MGRIQLCTVFFILLGCTDLFGQGKSFIVQHGNKYFRKDIAFEEEMMRFRRVMFQSKDTTYYRYAHEITAYQNRIEEYYKAFKVTYEEEEIDYFLRLHTATEHGDIYTAIMPDYTRRIYLHADTLVQLVDGDKGGLDYRRFLRTIPARCRVQKEIIEMARHSEASITRAIKDIEKCKISFTPKSKWTVGGGIGSLRLSPNTGARDPSVIPLFVLRQNGYRNRSARYVSVGYEIPFDRSVVSFYQCVPT